MTPEAFLKLYDGSRAAGLRIVRLTDMPLPPPHDWSKPPAERTVTRGDGPYCPGIATSKEDDAIAEAWKAPRPNIIVIPKRMPASQAAGFHRNKF